jgi:hypothetical protein
MMSVDLSLFSAADLVRLLADLENSLRIAYQSIAPIPRHEVPAVRLIHIDELERKRTLYRARLAELQQEGPRDHRRDVDVPSVDEPVLVPIDRRSPPRRHERPLHGKRLILFLAANPQGTNTLKLAEECAEIQRELKLSPHRGDFRFESRWAVSVDELMRHLMELDPVVVHFSGHGGGSSGLLFQDENGKPQPVTPRALAMMIRASAQSARVVVLNACYSSAQAEALRSEVDCVVGMDGAIGDLAARAFAIRFYGALGNRRSIGNAVAAGIAALAAKQFPDEWLPRCQTREGLDEHQIILAPS